MIDFMLVNESLYGKFDKMIIDGDKVSFLSF